jgi:DNA-binding HxlR family transcriptional regulator
MAWSEIGDQKCSIARALSVVGERWTILLLRQAFNGMRRFDEFQRDLGISRNLLTMRLQTLVENRIFERILYQEKPPRYEYRLTEKGRALYPVILSLLKWGDDWLAGDEGPPVVLVHEPCGHATSPKLVCSECEELLSERDVRAESVGRDPVRTSRSSG